MLIIQDVFSQELSKMCHRNRWTDSPSARFSRYEIRPVKVISDADSLRRSRFKNHAYSPVKRSTGGTVGVVQPRVRCGDV